MQNTNNRNNCICFTAIKSRTPISLTSFEVKEFFDTILQITNDLGFEINFVGIDGNNFSDKVVNYSRVKKKLFENNFNGIESLTLFFADSNKPAYDWLFSAMITDSSYIICISEQFISLESDKYIQMVEKILTLNNFIYGYGYIRKFELGPEFYALGVGFGLNFNNLESNEIGRWMRFRMSSTKYYLPIFRDIFPVNLLNSEHLVYINEFLENNIGKIIHVDKKNFIWKVSDKEREYIRNLLTVKGVLIATNDVW